MKGLTYSLIFFLICGCVNTKQWSAEQYLLVAPVVKGNHVVPVEDFAYMHRQKPNGKTFIFFSKAGAYQRGERTYNPEKIQEKIDQVSKIWDRKIATAIDAGDSLKEARYIRKKKKKIDRLIIKKEKGNWLMRVIGEKPVFYDSLTTVRTAYEMTKLLETKGFFQGKVTFKTEEPSAKRKRVVYEIQENNPTFLGKITYTSSSPAIDSLIEKYKDQKLLKTGNHYNTAHIDAERTRIEQLLRNNGYLFFSRQYISFDVDTTHFQTFAKFDHTNYTDAQQDSLRKLKREINLAVIIESPVEGNHQTYNIEGIYMHQVIPKMKHLEPDTIISKRTNIRYIYVGKTLKKEYNVLDRRIRLRLKQLYNAQKIIDTQNSLNLLDMYKFVNVKTDTIGGKLHVHIYTNPLDRFQLTDEIGLNMAQGLPGPLANVSWKNRNTFGGAESFEATLRFLLDGQASTTGQGAYTSNEFGGSTSLTFPRVLFIGGVLPRSMRRNIYPYNPTTKITAGYGFTLRPEYTRTNLVASIAYKGQYRRATYNFTLSELSIINTTRLSPAFEAILDSFALRGNPIKNSFGRALVSSTYFAYTYSSTTDIKASRSYYFRILLETGGNVLRLLDKTFAKRDNDTLLGLPYFQFWRINPTFHYYIPLKRSRFLAFRFNAGIAVPFGHSSVLPFEKYFFAGGGSSLRAWFPLSLGPGNTPVRTETNGLPDYKFVKPAEILIEGNIEYRFPLYQGWIEGATFLDWGNTWILRENATSQGGSFQLNSFYKQFALGSGFGIRMNLPFILFRLDTGIKIHDPGRALESRWVLWSYKPADYMKQKLLRLNIAIGYPF